MYRNRSRAIQHPERIHPSLWRGSQLARTYQKTISTGYQQLDTQLPGKGWPLGVLIEIMVAHPGMGEIQLLKPALTDLEPGRSIILINPPHLPSSVFLNNWFAPKHRVFWIKTDTPADTLWAIEKTLQHNASAALLCWINTVHPASLRRLHLIARQSHTLLFSLRPVSAAQHASSAPLRLYLEPTPSGLTLFMIKRQGPLLTTGIPLTLNHSERSRFLAFPDHDTLDQRLPALSRPEQPFAAMEN